MVRVRYVPPQNPKAEVERLRSALEALEEWRLRYAPGSDQYWAIHDARAALNKVAVALAGEPLTRPLEAHSTPK